ncbi:MULTISPECIES: ATP-binding protein [Mycobacterium]|nr:MULTISPECIES: ATP-binding protein [Mycobacterium]
MGEVREMNCVGAADATTAGKLRRDLQRWLSDVIDESAEVTDIVLSVNEALANCVEHAYRTHDRVGQIRMQASYDPSVRQLRICVSDRGTWRPPVSRPRTDAMASRGITLMHALAERCTINVCPEGTTVCMDYAPRAGTDTSDG